MTATVEKRESGSIAEMRSVGDELKLFLYALVLLAVGFFVLLPVALLVLYSFSVGGPAEAFRLGFSGWTNAVDSPALMRSVRNSVELLITAQMVSFPIAISIAWLVARTDLPARGFIEFSFWISFFMPTLAVMLGWILCLDSGYGLFNKLATYLPFVDQGPFDINTFWGIVWVHIASHGISVKVMLLTPIFRNLDSALEEAARMSGASRLTTFARIVVPVCAPALLAVALMSMIRAMQSFEIELVLGAPFQFYVYSTQVYSLIAQEPPNYASASALATIGLAIIAPLIFLQRWVSLRRQYTTVSGKMRTDLVKLGGWKWPAVGVMILVVALLTLMPLVFVIMASTMKIFGFFEIPEPWTLEHWSVILRDVSFRSALGNTILMSLGAAVASVTMLSLIAYFSVRTNYRGRALLDFASWLPFAVPGLLFGLGLLYVFLELPFFRPLYGTIWLMILATVVTHMTMGTQIVKSGLLQLSNDLEEAAMVSGATWSKTLLRIVIPIMGPTLILVGIMAFITSARDVASVALVAAAGTKTLSLLQLDYMVQGRYGPAAVVSLIVVFLSTGVALAARALGLGLGAKH